MRQYPEHTPQHDDWEWERPAASSSRRGIDAVFVERLASLFTRLFALGVVGLRRTRSPRAREVAQMVACSQLHLLKTITVHGRESLGVNWGSLDGRAEPHDLGPGSEMSDRDYMDLLLEGYSEAIRVAGSGAAACTRHETAALCRATAGFLVQQRERFELYRELV